MGISPVSFADDMTSLINKGFTKMSGKLKGNTVYRRVSTSQIGLPMKKSEFVVLNGDNKVVDVFDRVVTDIGSEISPNRYRKTSFVKYAEGLTPKYTHETQIAPVQKLKDSEAKGWFSVKENAINPDELTKSRTLDFLSDTKGLIQHSFYTEKRGAESIFPGGTFRYTLANEFLPKTKVMTQWSENARHELSESHHWLNSEDPVLKYGWGLYRLKNPYEYVGVASSATGPKTLFYKA